MTALMYTDESLPVQPPTSVGPRQIVSFNVQMGNTHDYKSNRGGSPRPAHPKKGRFSVMRKPSSGATSYPSGYNPNVFTITAYLPYDGGKRLKLQCSPGQTVQQVIETGIPEFTTTSYQVYQFPSRALLNPEKDASVLQDQEISVEPMRSSSPDDIGDDRLAIVRELLKTEDTYLENLRNIFDIYMEPLKKWGLPQADMNTMFRSLSRLCDLLMNFFSELELAVQHWNTNSTRIEVQRIYEYHKFLIQLYKSTPKDHCDYSDLKYTVNCVAAMVQEREQQLVVSQNRTKLLQVQSRFPNDNLRLLENEVFERRSKSMSHASSSFSHLPKSRKSDMYLLEGVDGGPVTNRLYLTEGPVRIISGMQAHERFFFLFDDLLIIAKPFRKQKSQHKLYKRKEQLRLAEMWITDCVDEVLESTLPPDTAFVIGWPMTNCLAAFSTTEEKILWYNQLSKNISAQREAFKPDSISVQIINLTKSSNNIPVWMEVHVTETARSVLLRAVELFGIAVASNNCQLWVKFSKDDGASPLIGHEHPFAIQMYHNRQQVDYIGDAKPMQLQFVIKRRSALSTDPSVSRSGLKRQKFSFMRLVKQKSKRSVGVAKKKMFKVPLQNIIVNNQLPEILQEMLIRLYTEAPQTLGIFRQSANYRKVKDLKEALDSEERVDLTNVSIHVIGALLKDLLRSVPGGVLMSTRYTEFVATNDIKDIATRVTHLQKVISKLSEEHQLFLSYLFPLLHHISLNEEVNCMNTINLAICFAPSLLWPDSGLDVIKNEVPPLVQFLIEHSPKIFGAELPELYKQVSLPANPGVEQMEFGFESPLNPSSLVPTKVGDGSESSHKRTESMDSSLSEDSLYNKNSLLRAKRNGLVFSDSQLSTISQHDYDPPQRTRVRQDAPAVSGGHGDHLGAPVNKRVKKVREPKRSSSLQGPNDMSPRARHFYERKQLEARRRSLAVQNLPVKKLKQDYTPGVQTIPDSPMESQSSSSQDYHTSYLYPRVPKLPHYTDRHTHLFHEGRHEVARHSPQKKRRVPQHSNSFSKGTDNKPAKPMASSASWYDKLLPLEPDAKMRSRSMGTSLGTRHPLPNDGDSELRLLVGSGPIFEERPKLVFESHSQRHLTTPYSQVSSTQSMSSGRSGSSTSGTHYQPRKPVSMATSGSMTQESPDLYTHMEVTPTGNVDKDFLKVAEGKRLDISNNQDTPPLTRQDPPAPGLSSYYTPITKPEIVSIQPTTADDQSTIERKRADSTASVLSEASFSKSHSYQSFLSSQQKKDSLMSLTQASLDDRPESDQHLHSLPRPHTAEFVRAEKATPTSTSMYPPRVPPMLPVGAVLETVTDHDPTKLYPNSSGYNSDTESSPSRTLSRPDRKMLEVTSPKSTLQMPSRYSVDGARQRLSYHRQPKSKKLVRQNSLEEPPKVPSLPTSILMQVDLSQTSEPQVVTAVSSEPPTEETPSKCDSPDQFPPTGNGEGLRRKQKPDNSKIGQLVKTFSRPAIEANFETAKVKLGLIPPRQRSKSTSEKEAMRIIHKIVEEDESAARTAEEEERAEKHKAWASSAPTTADRKKAWQSLSQDSFKRAETRTRSLKHEGTPVVDKVLPKSPMTPELKRKSATMPEYLVTGPRRTTAQIRTYKVVTYDTPKPERIRRINLRTHH